MNISALGIDIAKNIFQLHGVDSSGKRILKQRIEREQLSAYVANLPLCTIAMASCGGANYYSEPIESDHFFNFFSYRSCP